MGAAKPHAWAEAQERTCTRALLSQVKRTVLSCGAGIVLAVDPELTVLSRTWCLLEVWLAAYYGDTSKVGCQDPPVLILQVCCLGVPPRVPPSFS